MDPSKIFTSNSNKISCGSLKVLHIKSFATTTCPLFTNSIEYVGTGNSATIDLGEYKSGKLINFLVSTDADGCATLTNKTLYIPLLVNNEAVKRRRKLFSGDVIEIYNKTLIYQVKEAPHLCQFPYTDEEECGSFLFIRTADDDFRQINVLKNRTYIFGSGKYSCVEMPNTQNLLKQIHFQIVIKPDGSAYLINNDVANPILINKRKMQTGDTFGILDVLNVFNELLIEYKQSNPVKIEEIEIKENIEEDEDTEQAIINIKTEDNEDYTTTDDSDSSEASSSSSESISLSTSSFFLENPDTLVSERDIYYTLDLGPNHEAQFFPNNSLCRVFDAEKTECTSEPVVFHPPHISKRNRLPKPQRRRRRKKKSIRTWLQKQHDRFPITNENFSDKENLE